MKHRRQQNEVQLNIDVPAELQAAMVEYALRENVTRKLVVETALRRFLISEKALKAEKRMRG